jgi:hypothetical protein
MFREISEDQESEGINSLSSAYVYALLPLDLRKGISFTQNLLNIIIWIIEYYALVSYDWAPAQYRLLG